MYTLFLKHFKKVRIKINENSDEKKMKNLFSIKKGKERKRIFMLLEKNTS